MAAELRLELEKPENYSDPDKARGFFVTSPGCRRTNRRDRCGLGSGRDGIGRGKIRVMRKIVHVDMDAFYASVEQRNDPSLKGKPVSSADHPTVEVSFQPVPMKQEPTVYIQPCPRRRPTAAAPMAYSSPMPISASIRESQHKSILFFREVTDLVEPLSLDEAYLDVTVNKLRQPSATRVAEWIRRRIKSKPI